MLASHTEAVGVTHERLGGRRDRVPEVRALEQILPGAQVEVEEVGLEREPSGVGRRDAELLRGLPILAAASVQIEEVEGRGVGVDRVRLVLDATCEDVRQRIATLLRLRRSATDGGGRLDGDKMETRSEKISRSGAGRLLLFLVALLLILTDFGRAAAVVHRSSLTTSVRSDWDHFSSLLGRVAVFRSKTSPRGLVILLSDARGWTKDDRALADRLTAQGALVTGISTPVFLHALGLQKTCINPNYAIVPLAREIQHRLGVPMYMKPVLVGRGLGATFAYATLVTGPDGAYRAVVTAGFRPFLPGRTHWCKSAMLSLTARPYSHIGRTIAPVARLASPWISLNREGVDTQAADFARYRGATVVGLDPHFSPDALLAAQVKPFIAARYAAPESSQNLVPMPANLPITIVDDPAARRTDRMAVIYSGDGGWVGLDKGVAAELAKAGVRVVGVDSLSYFWSERTPAGAAADLASIIRSYSQHWGRPKVLLVGYSFGADVLPYIAGHLARPVRSQVKGMALLGLSGTADFQFHLSNWLNMSSTGAYPTIPAIARLRGVPMLCIRGNLETDSACPDIPRGIATVVTVPGGHHFERNAPFLVAQILRHMPR